MGCRRIFTVDKDGKKQRVDRVHTTEIEQWFALFYDGSFIDISNMYTGVDFVSHQNAYSIKVRLVPEDIFGGTILNLWGSDGFLQIDIATDSLTVVGGATGAEINFYSSGGLPATTCVLELIVTPTTKQLLIDGTPLGLIYNTGNAATSMPLPTAGITAAYLGKYQGASAPEHYNGLMKDFSIRGSDGTILAYLPLDDKAFDNEPFVSRVNDAECVGSGMDYNSTDPVAQWNEVMRIFVCETPGHWKQTH